MNTGQIINSSSNNRYTCLSNEILQSKELSLEEKGLLCHLLSLPPDWVVYIKTLPSITGESPKTVSRVFKLLQDKGYVLSTKQIGEDGQFMGWNHIVYSIPTLPKGYVGTPHRDALLPTSVNTDLRESVSIQSTNNIQNTKNTIYTEFLDLFKIITGKNVRGNSKSMRQFSARLSDGWTLDDFKIAIKSCFEDPFHKENPKYLTTEFITRPDKLEKYAAIAPKPEIKEITHKDFYGNV
jgi:uncharacterized phage protein (TIGR02220 family)